MLIEASQRGVNVIMAQQFARYTSVFSGYEPYFTKNSQCPERDVFEVAYWR